jgi:hypothetical protein
MLGRGTPEGRGVTGLQPSLFKIEIKKKHFVDTIILNVELDCIINRNQPLKPTDD